MNHPEIIYIEIMSGQKIRGDETTDVLSGDDLLILPDPTELIKTMEDTERFMSDHADAIDALDTDTMLAMLRKQANFVTLVGIYALKCRKVALSPSIPTKKKLPE